MRPSIGYIVHYVALGTPKGEYPQGIHRAAIITEVWEGIEGARDAVGLCILNPTGLFFNERVEFDPTGTKVGTWHWPEKEE